MGSTVISSVLTDLPRFPHAMVVGDVQQTSSQGSDRNHSSTGRGYQQGRYGSVPPPIQTATSGSSSSTRLPSQNAQNNARADGQYGSGSVHSQSSESSWQTNAMNIVHNSQNSAAMEGYDQAAFPLSNAPRGLGSSPPSPRLQPTLRSPFSPTPSGSSSPNRIRVRDLNHIQSFASEEVLTRSRHGSHRSLRGGIQDRGQQYEISAMPVTDIIEMVAGLLTKITTTNDQQHEHMHRHIPPPEGTSGLNPQTASVLAFHGRNVPSITILSYLSRIHKYCPTTYEVFLSLLVYFDRMTETINNGSLQSFRHTEDLYRTEDGLTSPSSESSHSRRPSASFGEGGSFPSADAGSTRSDRSDLSNFFVVDSFNIHRLVIAGVTCASKFFSDVFYTNSRYAKVGCLPNSLP